MHRLMSALLFCLTGFFITACSSEDTERPDKAQQESLSPQTSTVGDSENLPRTLDNAAETGVDAIESADDSTAAGAGFNSSGGVVVPRIEVPKGGTE